MGYSVDGYEQCWWSATSQQEDSSDNLQRERRSGSSCEDGGSLQASRAREDGGSRRDRRRNNIGGRKQIIRPRKDGGIKQESRPEEYVEELVGYIYTNCSIYQLDGGPLQLSDGTVVKVVKSSGRSHLLAIRAPAVAGETGAKLLVKAGGRCLA